MTNHIFIIRIKYLFFVLLGIMLMARPSFAVVFNMTAEATTVTMPDNTIIDMWGFGLNGGYVSVPGPLLEVPPGDTTLIINLENNLSDPVSIVIPGQPATFNPQRTVDGRVQSFTDETAPGDMGTYTWNNLKPGSYIYHSGTHPAVQVQMGLYGGIKIDAAVGEAYSGIFYDNEVVLFYSEIDPALHAAVASDSYGSFPYTSTIDYKPKYFLVNGQPYPDALPLYDDPLQPSEQVLLRFFNAGLKTHVPVLQGPYMSVIAEDGNLYPYPKEQYSVMLAALKTRDALVTLTEGTYPVYDRKLDLTNNSAPEGGMLVYLDVGASASNNAPVSVDDVYSVVQDTPLNISAPGVLSNDTDADGDPLTAILDSGTTNGNVTLNTNGSFMYTPNAGFIGTDSFTYKVNDGIIDSNTATVTITINPVNDAPVAVDDAYSVNENTTLNIVAPGVLNNDTDADGDMLTSSLVTDTTSGTVTLNSDGSFVYMPTFGATGTDSFTYKVNDGTADSNVATVTITLIANAPNVKPVAVNDFATTSQNTSVDIDVLANDTDSDGTIDPTTVQIKVQPKRGGTVSVDAVTGVVTFMPRLNFKGTDVFKYIVKDDDGADSNRAKVRVNVVTP
jgi:VCBS repeat-containing protein